MGSHCFGVTCCAAPEMEPIIDALKLSKEKLHALADVLIDRASHGPAGMHPDEANVDLDASERNEIK